MKLLAREAPEAPQIIKTTATAVNCMPDSESKTLLLKTSLVHTLPAGHAEIKLKLNQKLPSY